MPVLPQPHAHLIDDRPGLTQWLFRLWKGELPFTQSGIADTVAETVASKIQRAVPLEPQDFMTAAQKADVAAYTYGVNVTTPVKAFFDACIDNAHPGYIGPGGYLVTEGTLAFDNGFVDTAWPVIKTAGHNAVTLKAAGTNDSPILSITNGTADSSAGKFWRGGCLGGMTFLDDSGDTATSRHGLRIRGCWGMKFGFMRGDSLRADLINMAEILFNSTNPDPYAVFMCDFEGVEANSCVGWAFNNSNFVGLTHNEIHVVRAISTVGGGIKGLGTCNKFHRLTMYNVTGWAVDDGITNTGGSSSRVEIACAELDNVNNGFRLNFTQLFTIKARLVHRFQDGANASANYWPRIGVSLAPSGSPSVRMGTINLQHRIETGGVLADLGEFVDGNSSANSTNVEIDQQVTDNASTGFADSDLYTGINANATILLKKNGTIINDTRIKVAGVFRGSAAGTALTVGADPIATVDTSTTVTVTMTGHGLVANQCFTLQGAALTNNVPAAQLNRSHFVTSVVDADSVTIVVETAADATGSGGGAGVTGAKDRTFINVVGFGTAKCKVAFPTELYDQGAYYAPTLYEFTVPYAGLYRLAGHLFVTGLAAGNRIRLAFHKNIHTSAAVVLNSEYRCQGANRERVDIGGVVSLVAGDKICFSADNNTAGAIAPSISDVSDALWSIEAI